MNETIYIVQWKCNAARQSGEYPWNTDSAFSTRAEAEAQRRHMAKDYPRGYSLRVISSDDLVTETKRNERDEREDAHDPGRAYELTHADETPIKGEQVWTQADPYEGPDPTPDGE
jgi:hypothetical protein